MHLGNAWIMLSSQSGARILANLHETGVKDLEGRLRLLSHDAWDVSPEEWKAKMAHLPNKTDFSRSVPSREVPYLLEFT